MVTNVLRWSHFHNAFIVGLCRCIGMYYCNIRLLFDYARHIEWPCRFGLYMISNPEHDLLNIVWTSTWNGEQRIEYFTLILPFEHSAPPSCFVDWNRILLPAWAHIASHKADRSTRFLSISRMHNLPIFYVICNVHARWIFIEIASRIAEIKNWNCWDWVIIIYIMY